MAKEINSIIIFLIVSTLFGCQAYNENTMKKNVPPRAKIIPKKLEIHNDVRIDNYYWLNDRENSEVIDYLNAENEYKTRMLKETEPFQEALYQEMKGRIKETDMSVPVKRRGYYYYSRVEEGKQYGISCRKKGSLDSEEEILIDQNERAKGHDFYALGGLSIADDNNLMAFSEDTVGRRIYTIRFKNLETGEMLPDILENTTGGITWAADNKTVFYTVKDETLRPYKIFRHTLGTPQSADVEVYHEEDPAFNVFVYRTKSRKYIIIGSSSTVSSEVRYAPAGMPESEFVLFQPRERDLEYGVAHFNDHWYIVTNYKAKNFRLMKTPLDHTTKEHWEEVIGHRDDVLLEGMVLFKNYLVLTERKDGLIHLRIMPWDGSGEHYIEFDDPAYAAGPGANPDYDTETLRFSYTSMVQPSAVYDYNMRTRERKLLKEQEVVGGYDKSLYESKRFYVEARDGARVPVSMVYRKDLLKTGGNPLLLYGYGSYGYSIDPTFSSIRLSLLDRGFIYVIAHIRGGEELGRQWYEDGKLLKKKNTFFDFIDVAEFLVKEGYTTPDHLYAMGGSAGGLLMGAVINYRPDLWKGIVAAVPFVDVVTTMLDESIPLTTGEFDEWGNPKEEKYYFYMKSYSPYDNVEAKDYPNMLVTAGLHDSQVQYWEPAKWVAKLRELKTDDNLLLLYTNMDAGHGGASGRYEALREVALEYVFLLHLEGIKE